MRKWQIFLILGIIFFAFTEGQKRIKSRAEEKSLASALSKGGNALAANGIPESCHKKKFCVTVFVAPWCGACKQTLPTIKALSDFLKRGNRPDVGFGAVIGAASPAENLAMKQDMDGVESILDDKNEFMKRRQIRVFPTWIVTDETGKEVTRKPGGYKATSDGLLQSLLKDAFGI